MFGWLKSLFGSEPEAERIVPPPLPSKVKKAEKLVSKKVSKRASPKVEAPKEVASKAKVAKAPKKVKVEVAAVEAVSATDTAVEKVTPVKKKGGRPKKAS